MYDYSLWVINVASTVSITKGNTCTGQKTWQKKAQSHLSGSMVACWPKGSHIGVLVCPEPPDIAGGLYLSGLERARRKDRDREDSRAYFSASRWRWWGGNSRSRNSKETTGTAGLMSAWAAAGKSSCKVHLMLSALSPCRHLLIWDRLTAVLHSPTTKPVSTTALKVSVKSDLALVFIFYALSQMEDRGAWSQWSKLFQRCHPLRTRRMEIPFATSLGTIASGMIVGTGTQLQDFFFLLKTHVGNLRSITISCESIHWDEFLVWGDVGRLRLPN
jgi:hypothetical protein